MTLTAGQVLQNRYRIVALLGQGGMGAVYRAEDLRLRVFVALKEMVPQPELDLETLRQIREQFEREAFTLARMKHPHLVGVSDFFTEGDRAYLVMEFVEGESLAAYIHREGPLSEDQVTVWARQLLDALAYCHERGVIHRDIKPQNVVITSKGSAVLVDFGLVKLWDPADPQTRTVVRGMGTPEYAPPEQWGTLGYHTDPRTDLYSLGATLYHALAGRVPLAASDRMAFPEQFRTPRELNGLISPEMDHVIQKAMALARDARWANAQEMAAVLAGTAMPGRTRAMLSVRQPERRHTPRLWFAGTALVLLLTVGVVAAIRWRSDAASPAQPTEGATRTPMSTRDEPTPQAVVKVTGQGSPMSAQTVVPTAVTVRAVDTATPGPVVMSPTPRALPTSTPRPTDTPSCPPVQGVFASVWEATQARLGCAQDAVFSGLIAEESFEGGRMFWREPLDTAQALVVFSDGSWRIFRHAPFVEGSSEFPCADADTPAQCPPTPKRGFGMMWCDLSEIRSSLGRALDCERGYTGSLQLFDGGSTLRTDTGNIYVFYANGQWERW